MLSTFVVIESSMNCCYFFIVRVNIPRFILLFLILNLNIVRVRSGMLLDHLKENTIVQGIAQQNFQSWFETIGCVVKENKGVLLCFHTFNKFQ